MVRYAVVDKCLIKNLTGAPIFVYDSYGDIVALPPSHFEEEDSIRSVYIVNPNEKNKVISHLIFPRTLAAVYSKGIGRGGVNVSTLCRLNEPALVIITPKGEQ